jgi:hypothetical protein
MRRKIRRTAAVFAASALVTASLALPGTASAKVFTVCEFEKGTTTCIDVKGSHAVESEHQGSIGSNGVSKNPDEPCKFTGSDQTNECEL